MKKCLLILLLAMPGMAQAFLLPDTAKKTPVKPTAHQKMAPSAYNHPLSFQLEAGTQGFGGDFRYGVLSRFSVRLGASFIPFNRNNLISLSGFDSQNSINVNFFNAHLLADFVPFKHFRSLRFVGGGAYLYKADGGFTVIPTGSYTYNNVTVTGNDIGTINMNVSWRGLAPYAGLGLFRSFPHHFFNFNLDLGTYYLSAPKTHIIGTGLLADNYKLEPQFNENLKEYRWLPVLQLNFNFRLK